MIHLAVSCLLVIAIYFILLFRVNMQNMFHRILISGVLVEVMGLLKEVLDSMVLGGYFSMEDIYDNYLGILVGWIISISVTLALNVFLSREDK